MNMPAAPHSMKTGLSAQKGSVILESMIAILIFSIGILAIVGLQSASINNVAASKYRSDASLLANQIIGQMWSSDKNNAALAANFSSPSGANYLTWASSVQQALPGVVSSVGGTMPIITVNGVNPLTNRVTITIFWRSPGETTSHQHMTITDING